MNIIEKIKEFSEQLPHFEDGRIDYTDADVAPVLSVFVFYNEKLLLLKRSDKVANYKGKWNVVVGFLDDTKPIREKALEELAEETKITESDIKSIHESPYFELPDKSINKTWLVQPVLVYLKKQPEIILDWEHTEYQWIKPEDLTNYDTVPGLDINLRHALS